MQVLVSREAVRKDDLSSSLFLCSGLLALKSSHLPSGR
jgi:hypothetical protein